MARVRLLQNDEVSPEFQEIFEGIKSRGGRVLNLFRCVAHSPQAGSAFLKLGNALLFRGTIPPVWRELAILRVGNLCKAHYEWTQHVKIARRVGVRESQIAALPEWDKSAEFSNEERVILRFTDEETLNIGVSQKTVESVLEILGEEGLVELSILVGYYGMVCRVLETLDIELEQVEDGAQS
ncbi:MAG: carboxymuconolactone decarboxylase family protein [Syntrophales bacterium]|nr:carboxymuconolactone decarboxylase family protein [Syntrophales bacterium]